MTNTFLPNTITLLNKIDKSYERVDHFQKFYKSFVSQNKYSSQSSSVLRSLRASEEHQHHALRFRTHFIPVACVDTASDTTVCPLKHLEYDTAVIADTQRKKKFHQQIVFHQQNIVKL
uniref:Uncharacterized protein n=1 Tax=Cacopsylla melanoneura TaxID=428564 RepID=A0A8D8SX63_9HEMI